MKYLKRFNESTETKVFDQSVVDECEDILLELEDKGFKTNINSHLNKHYSYIQFYFNRNQEFDYSDIEDVVERLKSYLSEFGLKIEWMSPTERSEQRPTIQTTSVINPMTFTPEGVVTRCELHFDSN